MTTVEQEILEKFQQLDSESKRRILASLEQEVNAPTMDLGQWLEQATGFRGRLRAKYGQGHFFGTQTLLDEVREEGFRSKRHAPPVRSFVRSYRRRGPARQSVGGVPIRKFVATLDLRGPGAYFAPR